MPEPTTVHDETLPPPAEERVVWLTRDGASSYGGHKGIYATLDLAKQACEEKVADWIVNSPWADEDEQFGPPPQLHPVVWTREPDPGVPALFHPKITEDKYIWVGRYCAEEPGWYMTVASEVLVDEPHAVASTTKDAALIEAARAGRRATLDPGAFVTRGRDSDGEYERLDLWQERALLAAVAALSPGGGDQRG